MKPTVLIILSILFSVCLYAQENWDGKKCAVCLTYDDAMDSHLDNAIPQLNKFKIQGTFYLTGSSATINNRMEEWRDAAKKGHELGNHTIFHPCSGNGKNRDWVNTDRDLDNYSYIRFVNEIKVANTLLKAIDGKDKRTYAYTCGDMLVEDKDMVSFLPDYVLGARSTRPVYEKKEEIDIYNIPAFSCTAKTAEQIIALIEKAKETNSLMVLLFHGTGGGHLNVEAAEHEKLLQYLHKNKKDIWVAPFIDVVEYLRE